MTFLDDMYIGSLLEFNKIQRSVEWGKWIAFIPIWIEFPSAKEDVKRYPESNGGGITGQVQRKSEAVNN